MKRGLKHGIGVYYYPDGNLKYQVEFLNDRAEKRRIHRYKSTIGRRMGIGFSAQPTASPSKKHQKELLPLFVQHTASAFLPFFQRAGITAALSDSMPKDCAS